MTNFKWFGSLVLAAAVVSTLGAETHCPGNVASVPFHLVNRHQIIVAVSVNHSGPYDFLLDTGTQVTMLDSGLAAELKLSTHGEAKVASAGFSASATFADLDSIGAGSHAVSSQKVLVYDLQNLQAAGLKIRGVLGEDFLEQFDMLIDNAHNLLCLDESTAMRAEVKGKRVSLLAPDAAQNGAALPKSLIVAVRLSDGMRPVRLKLDSGANVPFLYNTPDYMALGAFRGASLRGGANGAQRTFTALPPQNVKIGSVELSKVLFVTLAGARKDQRTSDFDGLLTVGLFRWVFVCHSGQFSVFGV
jgi:Aspartyl protease